MRDIIYIVEEEIVDTMNRTVTVQSIVGNVLTTCGVKWAAADKVVEDGNATEFTVASVDYDADTITLVNATGFTGDMTLQKPYFFVGTPMATNAEWEDFAVDILDKTPFIWMVEPTRERFDYTDLPIERESDVRVEFLDFNDITNWITTQTHQFKLRSLYNMYEEFVLAIQNNVLFDIDKFTTGDVRNLTKFGTETANGFDSNIIDANLTGLDTRVTLPININSECNC